MSRDMRLNLELKLAISGVNDGAIRIVELASQISQLSKDTLERGGVMRQHLEPHITMLTHAVNHMQVKAGAAILLETLGEKMPETPLPR